MHLVCHGNSMVVSLSQAQKVLFRAVKTIFFQAQNGNRIPKQSSIILSSYRVTLFPKLWRMAPCSFQTNPPLGLCCLLSDGIWDKQPLLSGARSTLRTSSQEIGRTLTRKMIQNAPIFTHSLVQPMDQESRPVSFQVGLLLLS